MAAQKLFSDFPTTSYPGMVTPNITADIQQTPVSIQDQAAAYALQQRMKADRKAEWASASAKNKMRQAVGKLYGGGGGHYLPPTHTNTTQAYKPPGQGNVIYTKLQGGALGTFADQEQKRAMRENRRPPTIVMRYADDPSMNKRVRLGGLGGRNLEPY